jgi:hypothetical protein
LWPGSRARVNRPGDGPIRCAGEIARLLPCPVMTDLVAIASRFPGEGGSSLRPQRLLTNGVSDQSLFVAGASGAKGRS